MCGKTVERKIREHICNIKTPCTASSFLVSSTEFRSVQLEEYKKDAE